MQAKSAVAAKERLQKTTTEEMETLSKQNKQREEQLTSLLQETETRNSRMFCYLFVAEILGINVNLNDSVTLN